MHLTVIQCDSESFNAALPPKDPTPKFRRSLSESSAWVTRELWELHGTKYLLLIWNISFSGYIQQYSLNYENVFVIHNDLLHIAIKLFSTLNFAAELFTFGLRFPHGVDVSINTCLMRETQSDCKYCFKRILCTPGAKKARERMSGCNSAGAKSTLLKETPPNYRSPMIW